MAMTSDFWVSAYLELRLAAIPAFVVAHGDAAADAVVKLNTLDGQAKAFQRSFDLMTGDLAWVKIAVRRPRA
jgi:hypothetical protein